MTRNDLSIFTPLRPVTVGFDPIFDHFERMFDNDTLMPPSVNYPPYNIVKTGDFTYNIEVALAGFSKKDIEVNYADNTLTIKSISASQPFGFTGTNDPFKRIISTSLPFLTINRNINENICFMPPSAKFLAITSACPV